MVLMRIHPSTGLHQFFRIPEPDQAFVVNWKDSVAALVHSKDRLVIDFYLMAEDVDKWTKLYSMGVAAHDDLIVSIPQCMATGEIVMHSYRSLVLGDFNTSLINFETGSVTVSTEIEESSPIWHRSYSHVESLISSKGMVNMEIEQVGESGEKNHVFKNSSGWLPKDFESVLIEYWTDYEKILNQC
ncbi:hypothetical protein POM88_033293 [Heracleum sosnowskyi]|uniref:Uncharacterized protein n=1 Tax=Heracleum sosnowskyi TaxID=360622 RepID=A0AAD8MID7_9APIA|nr:hypothetical protein POM88_033293 [Heracleum sosnowskyi]